MSAVEVTVSLKGGVVLDGAAVAQLLRGPSGPVMRDMAVRATRVQTTARHLAPVSNAPGRVGGTLRNSIIKRIVADSRPPGAAWLVGSAVPYAFWVHQGTVPHVIRPRKAGGFLAFYSRRAGRVVIVRSVRHPGTKPTHFLVNALPAAATASI